MGISDPRCGSPSGYVFPSASFPAAGLPGSSAALSAHAIPFHPGEPDGCFHSFLHRQLWASPYSAGWPLSPLTYHEAESGSLALWLTPLSHEASPARITPACARLTTCATSNSHGELLSVHEISQAYPGAPNKRMKNPHRYAIQYERTARYRGVTIRLFVFVFVDGFFQGTHGFAEQNPWYPWR